MGKFRNGYLDFNTGVAANKILDEDNMTSNDDEALATQQSIKEYIDNKTSGTVTQHYLDDATAHIGIFGVEDNFMSIDSDGLPQDSGYNSSDFESSGTISTHESTYNHTDLHTRDHNINSIADHNGVSGAIEDNLVSFDSNGLPQDSGYDSSSFVTAGLEDTIIFAAGRNSISTTNLYLRDANGIPTNQSPFIIPWNCTLISMTLSTDGNETWTAELHSGLLLVSGATLSATAQSSNYSESYNINFNAGDPIELYCNGTGINKPRITTIFRRR